MDEWGARPGETATAAVVRGIFEAIDQGFAESGCPLSDEQRAVFNAGLALMATPAIT